jgi:hypothetical protein
VTCSWGRVRRSPFAEFTLAVGGLLASGVFGMLTVEDQHGWLVWITAPLTAAFLVVSVVYVLLPPDAPAPEVR